MSESPFQRRGPRRIDAAPRAAERLAPRRRGSDGKRQGSAGGPLLIIGAVVVALAILLLVLFVEPIALLDRDNDEAGSAGGPVAAESSGFGVEAKTRARMPDVPDNLRPVSLLYDLTAPSDLATPIAVTLRLIQPTQDQRNLGAYTYQEGLWQRLNPALLSADGAAATAELESVPANVAILRRLQFRDTLTGRLAAGQELAAEGVNSLTVINPVGFRPAADASLLGRVEALPSEVTQPIYPVVYAEATEADIINTVLASPLLRRQHINNLLLMVQTGRYDGVDIDYQVISPALRDAFTAFITDLATELHAGNRGLSLTVPLPLRDPSGINEGAYDLGALGAAADQVKIVPPRDPSIWREAMSTTLPFVLERVPSAKVLLVVSPYGIRKTGDGLQELSQRDALEIASRLNVREPGPLLAGQRVTLVGDQIFQDGGASGLFWDQQANMVSFVYPTEEGGQETVWIENRFSLAFKLQLAAQYKLGGVTLADVSADPGAANLWATIGSFLESGDVGLTLPNPELLAPSWEADAGELSGSGRAGWAVWTSPAEPGTYEARLIVGDGDVRVGHALSIVVEP